MGRVMDDFRHLSKRVTVTNEDITGLVDRICSGPVPFPNNIATKFHPSSTSDFCRRMLFRDIPGLVHTTEVGRSDPVRAGKPTDRREAMGLVLGIIKSLHAKTSRIHVNVDATAADVELASSSDSEGDLCHDVSSTPSQSETSSCCEQTLRRVAHERRLRSCGRLGVETLARSNSTNLKRKTI